MLSFGSALVATSLAALAVSAAPTQRGLEKRILKCWSTNPDGCTYGTTGDKAAVVTVSRFGLIALMFRKSEPAQKSVSTSSMMAVTLRMVGHPSRAR